MAITGGAVTFEQSRKLAEYENRKVSITFNVNEPDGDDAQVQVFAALKLAQDHCLAALGLGAAPAAVASDTSEKPKRGRPPKTPPAEPPKVADAASMAELEAPQIRANPENQIDPNASAAEVVDESLFNAPDAPKVDVVTDTDLLSHITRKNAALQMAIGAAAPPKIRALVGKYAKSAKDIPADKRRAFLDELAALTA